MSEIIHRTFKKPIQWEAIKTYELSDEMAVFMALIKRANIFTCCKYIATKAAPQNPD